MTPDQAHVDLEDDLCHRNCDRHLRMTSLSPKTGEPGEENGQMQESKTFQIVAVVVVVVVVGRLTLSI